jgi:hypothetical protein
MRICEDHHSQGTLRHPQLLGSEGVRIVGIAFLSVLPPRSIRDK